LAPRGYVIAATPRTGSTLLCEALAATGAAGIPNEAFPREFRPEWCRRWGLPTTIATADYVREALRRGTTANGMCAFKIHWMHVGALAYELGVPAGQVLERLLPGAQFINIIRRDRRAQALSWFRALETGQWHRLPNTGNAQAPSLDPAAVRRLEARIAKQQAAWETYFAQNQIAPLTIEYEDLDRDHRHAVAKALRFLGLDPGLAQTVPPPRLARQADALTARWRAELELQPS
jgi:LPS sulfotransferase NodH